MKKLKIGIYWFNNDLRLHDNPALMRARAEVDELLCVYVIDHTWWSASQYSSAKSNQNQERFLEESLRDLDLSLKAIGQRLIIIRSRALSVLNDLIGQSNASYVFRSDNAGLYENRVWKGLKKSNETLNFYSVATHTLFDTNALPFILADLPDSFTKFKNAVKETDPIKPIELVSDLPPPPRLNFPCDEYDEIDSSKNRFRGGETEGITHLQHYFTSKHPSNYKVVRNAIDGWDNSCKLSPWLANGCLSVREVVSVLSDYETKAGANESTYWIYFELLWREYFQWYARKNGARLFSLSGIKRVKPLTSYYPERFQKWVNGSTPFPIVNACMNELRETGYLSNRGRQIVASCLVNELAMDWCYGAAYFEQVLIDYDVASNWANWQYLGGVGADAGKKRHFNLEKQTQLFDPDGRYIDLWYGQNNLYPLDSLDAADWPI